MRQTTRLCERSTEDSLGVVVGVFRGSLGMKKVPGVGAQWWSIERGQEGC